MKIPPWSFSSIKAFGQCPKKYYHLKVVKDYKEPLTDAITYGSEFHKAAELYIKEGIPLPPHFNYAKGALDNLNQLPGDKLCEYEMGLTENLDPCGFKDEQVWWRGIADLIIIDGEKAFLVDYKTSKSSKYADTAQLELLSLAIFKHFPQVKKVKAGLLFVVVEDFVKVEYVNDEGKGKAWIKWLEATHTLESCMKNDVWNAKPNFTCKNFCPVIDCTHNGRQH